VKHGSRNGLVGLGPEPTYGCVFGIKRDQTG
jgi:hypothetical protein